MAFGWEGEKVRLVPIDRERHLENSLRWINDPEVTRWIGNDGHPSTRAAQEAWFTRHESLEGDIQFAIETLEGQHIGFSGLMEIDDRNGTAVCGTLMGDPRSWGKGYGTDAARLRSRFAFEGRGLRQLRSQVFASNERSLKMLRRVGFEEYGRLPKAAWLRGKFEDDVLMYLSRERWESLGA